jgi:hypothetical protein
MRLNRIRGKSEKVAERDTHHYETNIGKAKEDLATAAISIKESAAIVLQRDLAITKLEKTLLESNQIVKPSYQSEDTERELQDALQTIVDFGDELKDKNFSGD